MPLYWIMDLRSWVFLGFHVDTLHGLCAHGNDLWGFLARCLVVKDCTLHMWNWIFYSALIEHT